MVLFITTIVLVSFVAGRVSTKISKRKPRTNEKNEAATKNEGVDIDIDTGIAPTPTKTMILNENIQAVRARTKTNTKRFGRHEGVAVMRSGPPPAWHFQEPLPIETYRDFM